MQPKVGEYWYIQYHLTYHGIRITNEAEIDKYRIEMIIGNDIYVKSQFTSLLKRVNPDRLIAKVPTHWFWKIFGYK
jgi:hypothetical protein